MSHPTLRGKVALGQDRYEFGLWQTANLLEGAPKVKKILLTSIVLVALLALAVGSLPAAAADPPSSATTVAQITGSSMAPGVKAKWELPGAGSGVTMTSGRVFTPIPATNPTTSTNPICVWAIVTDTVGINNISGTFIDVYEPAVIGGPPTKFKLEQYLANETNLTTIRAAVAAGVASGQLTTAQQADIDEEILKFEALAFFGCWNYDVHQLSGTYEVRANAVNRQGATGTLANTLTITSIVSLLVDFTSVNYGNILPGVNKFVSGDGNLATPLAPTVWNRGNNPGALNIVSSPMTGVSFGKQIINFDVMLSSLVRTPVDYLAGQVAVPLGALQPCSPTQIDFSIMAPATAPNDTYNGTMTITIVEAI